eukprot:9079534-Karenia_brevis.AAC.1
MATTVPQKGGRGMFAVDKCIDFIDEVGDRKRDILIKSDTEEAMRMLKRCEDDEEADGEVPEGVTEEEREQEKGIVQPESGDKERTVYVNVRGKVPRGFKISIDDVNTHGPTTGCPGCRAVRRGAAYQYHTEECKKKFEKY